MRLTITKSKNSESFYITQSFINKDGKSTSKIIRKLGTLSSLCRELDTDREGVIKWARQEAEKETKKYRSEKEAKTVLIPFHADRQLDYDVQRFYEGGYLPLQSIYYGLKLDQTCRKIKAKYRFRYDLNAILSDLIYTRILEPCSKRSSFSAANRFLEPPTYELHDIYRALSFLAKECDFIQEEAYRNSGFVCSRNDKVLYYDCTNFYFEIEQEQGSRKYGKSKEHRPNPIIQMGMFIDGSGIPLAFTTFPGNQNEQKSLKPLEEKIIKDFGCSRFIYCSDAGLGSEKNRELNDKNGRAFIVTQSIKKLDKETREWALNRKGFKRVSDGKPIDIDDLSSDDLDSLFYKEAPHIPKDIEQSLIITYSPRYAAYQREIREKQVGRAIEMIDGKKCRKQRSNPNDPGRFVGKFAVTKDGEKARIEYYLDDEKIEEESRYDGMYAVCTNLLEDNVEDILKVSEGRWQIEASFRTMKTDFEARPVHVQREDRIQAHFLTCFLALLLFRILQQKLGGKYTSDKLLGALKGLNFADLEGQGFMPLYSRTLLTDAIHDAIGFRTDYQFITKQKMKEIQKRSKGRE